MDDWANMVTGVGTTSRDKRVSTSFYYRPVTPEEGLNLWLGDDLAARIVEELPSEALRQGFEVKVGDDKSLQELKGEAGVDGAAAPGKPSFGAKPGAPAKPGEKPKFGEKPAEKGAEAKKPAFGKRQDVYDEKRKPFGADAPAELDVPAEDETDDEAPEGVDALTHPVDDTDGETDTSEESGEDPAEIQEWLGERLKELGVCEKLERAACLERATGGAALLLGAVDTDNTDLKQPLTIEGVREFNWITVLEWNELTPATYYIDPRAPRYGEVETWNMSVSQPGTAGPSGQGKQLSNIQIEIHESRLVIFKGIQVSRRRRDGLSNGWGDNIFTRMLPVLRDFNSAFASAGILVQDFAQAIWGIKGLAELIAMDKSGALADRIRGMELARSTLGATVIDAEGETFERKATPVTGLPELLDRLERRLAASAGMPLTRLFGMSPGGLNATGASDQAFFYDKVQRFRKGILEPAIERIVELLLRAAGKDVDSWSIQWPSLYQATDLEKANIRKVVADTDGVNITNGVYTAEEAALRYAGDEFQIDLHLDFSARAMAEREEAALAKQEQEMLVAEAGAAAGFPGKGGPPKPGGGKPPFGGKPAGPPKPGGGKPPPFARADYDPDQPRDELGRWGEGGAGAKSKETPEAKRERRAKRVEKEVNEARESGRITGRDMLNAQRGRAVTLNERWEKVEVFQRGPQPTQEEYERAEQESAQNAEDVTRRSLKDDFDTEDAVERGDIVPVNINTPEVEAYRAAAAGQVAKIATSAREIDALQSQAVKLGNEYQKYRESFELMHSELGVGLDGEEVDDDTVEAVLNDEAIAALHDHDYTFDPDVHLEFTTAGNALERGVKSFSDRPVSINDDTPRYAEYDETGAVSETPKAFSEQVAYLRAAADGYRTTAERLQSTFEKLYEHHNTVVQESKVAAKATRAARSKALKSIDDPSEDAVRDAVKVAADSPDRERLESLAYRDAENRTGDLAGSLEYSAFEDMSSASKTVVKELAQSLKSLSKVTGRKWSPPKKAKAAKDDDE
jgi:phage-related protein (TIGR01555 family)